MKHKLTKKIPNNKNTANRPCPNKQNLETRITVLYDKYFTFSTNYISHINAWCDSIFPVSQIKTNPFLNQGIKSQR